MRVTEDISLDHYIGIPDDSGVSFGGSQMWFPENGSRRDRIMRGGACGLVAVTDLLLYVSRKENLSLTPVTGRPTSLAPGSRNAYLELLRNLSRHYPVLAKMGSFNVEIPLFLNSAFRRLGSKTRIRSSVFPTRKNLLDTVKRSLQANVPVILLIPPKLLPFTRMKGVPFYSFQNGLPKKEKESVRAHFVTITGLRCPVFPEYPLFYEISSWGTKYYLNSEELHEYLFGARFPLAACLFYLK